MTIKQFRILKAVHLLSAIGHGSKITVGEISRWSKIPPSTCKRHLEKMEAMGLVSHELFKRGSVEGCKDYSPTELGTSVFESQGVLL